MSDLDSRANPKQCGLHPAVVNGAGLMLVGVVLLLDQLGIVRVDFWALIFSVFGLVKIVQSSSLAGRLWGFFLLWIQCSSKSSTLDMRTFVWIEPGRYLLLPQG